jgi:uncharacterized membrane protein
MMYDGCMKKATRLRHDTGFRLLVCIVVGSILTLDFLFFDLGKISWLLGWDIAAALFIIWTWTIIWPMDHEETARFARREDPSRVGADIILLLASAASLIAVGAALFQAHATHNANHALFLTIVGIVSVIISWFLIHTVYTLRYARIHYGKTGDIVVFEKDHHPSFSDFAYLSFTLGMTFQVSDNTIIGSNLRKTVLRHVLLSYVFGTVIVATTVTLIISLGQ